MKFALKYALVSALCTLLSLLVVEYVASRGVEIEIGSEPLHTIVDPEQKRKAQAEFDRRVEEYKTQYRAEHDTFLKVHQSYKPYAWMYTWIPWLLPPLILRPKTWRALLALLPVPIIFTFYGWLYFAEIVLFMIVVAATHFIRSQLTNQQKQAC